MSKAQENGSAPRRFTSKELADSRDCSLVQIKFGKCMLQLVAAKPF